MDKERDIVHLDAKRVSERDELVKELKGKIT